MPQRNWRITGVSSGFGRIMTEQLLARGDRIATIPIAFRLAAQTMPATRVSARKMERVKHQIARCEAVHSALRQTGVKQL
jgi:NAD(P)-dependent dehydrogenase (short-subunit alcohol dehydrogenase family)